jgi:TRAP-type C4-dicarboxylate transport system permease small subunit
VSTDQRPVAPPSPERETPRHGVSPFAYFDWFTQALNIIGTVLILAMAVAVNADIIGRNGFNHPIAGVLEFIGLSIVAVVFLQMANTLREDRHVSNDVFIRMIAAASPRLASTLYAAFNIVGAALMLTIVIYVWPIVRENYEGGYYAGTAHVIEIPIWPFMAIIVLGAATTAIQFLINAGRNVMLVFRPA